MITAPLASTIIAIGLIPVAFLFVHAFLSGRGKNRIHPVTGALAITWDLSNVHRLYAASHSNHNINSNSDGLFWNTRSNRGLSDVFRNCGSRSWNFTVETKSVKQMALQTCQNSLPDMVVCFPLRRNSLLIDVYSVIS